jgi:hypothetical protein
MSGLIASWSAWRTVWPQPSQKWARPREIRQRDDRARLNAADTQLAGLEERVTLIEGRLSDIEFGPHGNQPEA